MIKSKVEKMEPFAEEKEMEEEIEKEEEEESEEEGGEDGTGDEEDVDDVQQKVTDNTEKKEEEPIPQAADKTEKKILPAAQPKKKRQDTGLNLNNEVVKMRKEVKRVRTLIIRKLARQMGALKKKKGKEADIERNQRRAARLLEELHAIKTLSPDLVTKTALQRNLSFENECKNPKSTISDRAIARIATHPQFRKKILDIKAAVRAFKEERMKGGSQGWKEKVQNKTGNVTPKSPDKSRERESEKEKKAITMSEKKIKANEGGDDNLKDTVEETVAAPEKETGKTAHSDDTAGGQRKEMPKPKDVRTAPVKSNKVKDIMKNKPQSEDADKTPSLKSAPEEPQTRTDEDESDLELSDDEEKEYFDDSTEERFYKQSSQSEESDEDDFFVGKVSKFKKKRKQKGAEVETAPVVKMDPTDKVQSKLDKLESRLNSKATSLQSVFCSSLSASKPGGGRGAGRGRGRDTFRGRGDTFRGQGKPRGGGGQKRDFGSGDFNKQSKFQNQVKEAEKKSGSKFNQPESSERGFPSVGRGRGRGRGQGRGDMMQRDCRGGGAFSRQAPQQVLHPSWEASKKRKEQQGQILAFQGKKIKFDDDD